MQEGFLYLLESEILSSIIHREIDCHSCFNSALYFTSIMAGAAGGVESEVEEIQLKFWLSPEHIAPAAVHSSPVQTGRTTLIWSHQEAGGAALAIGRPLQE